MGGLLCRGDVELYAAELGRHAGRMADAADELLKRHGENLGGRRNYEQVDRWAQAGAFLTTLAPNFPYLILELETYRGCTRDVFCSFCTEAFYGRPTFRLTDGILAEVAELRRMGNRFYRLGRQADLMTYLPDMNDFRNSFPRPRPESLARLYEGIRAAAPDLELLHLDNINPGLIATFPAEAREVTRIICEHNTAGDTAAMGLESVDETVIAANDLKCSPDEARTAIEIINEYGARREGGVPKLLPGLNFIHGLPGESDATFEKNYEFLMDLMQRGLLLRRINIRQVVDYKNTKLDSMRKDESGDVSVPRKRRRPEVLEKKFTYFRDRIRREVDQPMLLKNFPPGVKIEFVIPEGRNQGYILGRPLGSYPVTLKIPEGDPRASAAYTRMFGETEAVDHGYAAGSDDIGTRTRPLTVMVLGAEERSLVGLSWPVRINAINQRALSAIPGIGKKRASMVLLARPFANFEEFAACLERDGARVFGERGDYVFGGEDWTTEGQRTQREEAARQ